MSKYGFVAGLIRISDKLERIRNLVNGARQSVQDESLLDSVGDMATYCIMLAAECEIALDSGEELDALDDSNTTYVKKILMEAANCLDLSSYRTVNPLERANDCFALLENAILQENLPVTVRLLRVIYQSTELARYLMAWYEDGCK